MCTACGDTGYIKRQTTVYTAGSPSFQTHEWFEACLCRQVYWPPGIIESTPVVWPPIKYG